jgi:hypothetical protein
MSVIAEAEELGLRLSSADRGELISRLIGSLGSPFDDEDEDVIALALERDREMDEHPETVMSEEEFWDGLEEFRRP